MISVYVVCEDMEEASKISKFLVKEKLALCTNSWPINSCYEWEGKIKETEEVAMIIKTTKEKVDSVFEKVKEMHSYETPVIFTLKVGKVDRDYLDWVNSS